jgi:hypothetical protein
MPRGEIVAERFSRELRGTSRRFGGGGYMHVFAGEDSLQYTFYGTCNRIIDSLGLRGP